MALLGVQAMSAFPVIGYGINGTLDYNAAADTFNVDATPFSFKATSAGPTLPIQPARDFEIRILVDGLENASAAPGDDLEITGAIDFDGGDVDVSGTLLTGEVLGFGFLDSGDDQYDFRFRPTGGALASYFSGMDIGITLNSENSTFANSFGTNFTGGAKGTVYAIPQLLATIGNFVWHDVNANGIQDGSETGVAGATVELFTSGNALIGTQVTTATGLYLFTNLTPGDYYVKVTPPIGGGYEFSPQNQGGDDALDSDAGDADILTGVMATTTLTSGEVDLTWDAGIFKPQIIVNPAFIGDYVWHDLNANGIQENGEPGINGVKVELYTSAGALVATQATDNNGTNDGAYLFAVLTPGDYYVQVTPPAGYFISPQDVGDNDAVDSDADTVTGVMATTTLTSGEDDRTWDAGLIQAAPGVEIVKLTNGTDNNSPTGPVVPVGSTVTFSYIVTNTGNVPLGSVVVMDDQGVTVTYVNGDTDNDNLLDVTETWTYTGSKIAVAGQYINNGTVTGNPVDENGNDIPGLPNQTDTDIDHHFGAADITIKKFVAVQTPGDAVGGEGLTPGYWKQPHHFDAWTNFAPTDNYNTVFDVNDDASLTLLGALSRGGGGNKALGRHAVAAILNASHANIEYDLTVDQIIIAVQSAYTTGNFEPLKNQLDALNNQGADLSSGGGGGGATITTLDDANSPPGPTAQIGDTLVFVYEVTSDFPISNVVVVDDNATGPDFSPAFIGGDDGDNILEPGETWEYRASIIADQAGSFMNIATATGTPIGGGASVSDDDPAHYLVVAPPPPPSSLSGMVWLDLDNDGCVDVSEPPIGGVTITLMGTDTLENPVNSTTTTDQDGLYAFENLPAGTYKITETQPSDFADGKDIVGTINDIAVGQLANDEIRVIVLEAGQGGLNYNFGELPLITGGGAVHAGQTATIGFWHNKNGQALLKSLNGSNSKQLGYWMAATFPRMFGALAGASNLYDKTNTEIAKLYIDTRFKVKGQKLDAQVMALAFAVYVTDSDLANNVAASYGFEVTTSGVGAATFNVGSSGAAFCVANNTVLTVMEILTRTNDLAKNGILWDLDSSGGFSTFEQSLRNLANTVYTAINEAGDIE